MILLSLAVPVGFLITLRLTGVLHGAITISETMQLEPIEWQFERSEQIVDLRQAIERAYANDVFIDPTLFISDYWPRSEFGGSPLVHMNLSLTASSAQGHIENINITFQDEYLDSFVTIRHLEHGGNEYTLAVWKNLTAISYTEDFLRGIGTTEKAFVYLQGLNHPRGVYLRISPEWALRSPTNQTQQLTVTVEVTYYNGTAYNRVIQPFQIRVIEG